MVGCSEEDEEENKSYYSSVLEKYVDFISKCGIKFTISSFNTLLTGALKFGYRLWDFDKWMNVLKSFDFDWEGYEKGECL